MTTTPRGTNKPRTTDTSRTTTPPPPRTLKEAHDVAYKLRPKLDASLQDWLVFRQKLSALYLKIADIDRYHHHEALYWAEREEKEAQEISVRISAEKPQ
jgi:hypothetical protein